MKFRDGARWKMGFFMSELVEKNRQRRQSQRSVGHEGEFGR